MKYFKVKKTADNIRKNINKPDILIKNELYTERELSKFADVNNTDVKTYFTTIEIPKNDTYYLFGARFSKQFPYHSN